MLFLLILIACFVFQLFLPWWIIAPIAIALAAWKAETGKYAFWSGFAAAFVLWIIMGLVQTLPNDNILANRVAQTLMLPDLPFNWTILLFITGTTGGLVSGFAALAGFYTRQALAGYL